MLHSCKISSRLKHFTIKETIISLFTRLCSNKQLGFTDNLAHSSVGERFYGCVVSAFVYKSFLTSNRKIRAVFLSR